MAAGSELPGVLILAQHFHLKDGVGHGFTHNAFDLDNVFLRPAICLLIGSAQFVVEPGPAPSLQSPESTASFVPAPDFQQFAASVFLCSGAGPQTDRRR